MAHLPLLVRGLRWRSGASLALLATGTVAVFAAAIGPLYLLTSRNLVLHATLAQADPSRDGVTATALVPALTAGASGLAIGRLDRRLRLGRWYAAPLVTVDAGLRVSQPDQKPPLPSFATADLVARTGVCRHLLFVAGHCPTGVDQVALTARTGAALHVGLGGQLVAQGLPALRVAGIVALGDPSQPYWWGNNFFDFAPPRPKAGPVPAVPAQMDAIWAMPATLYGLPANTTVQLGLAIPRTRVGSLEAQLRALSDFDYVARKQFGMLLSTGLLGQLDTYGRQIQLMAVVVAVVDLQLVLLALLVLYTLSVQLAAGRQREVGLSKLRGLRIGSVLVVGLLEPALLALAALPLGLLVAWLLMRGVSPALFPGAEVVLTPLVPAAAGVALVGAVLAALVGGVRVVGRRPLAELRDQAELGGGRPLLVMDAMALALTVAGLTELLSSAALRAGRSDPIALLAPGLLAVAAAVLGVRVFPWLGGRLLGRRGPTASVSLSLALRQLLRRRRLLRQMVALTVAFALTGFAVNVWAVAAANRTLRADFAVGAARVLRAQVPPSVMLLYAVRHADPSGRYAMAAMEMRGPGEQLLAVDASRLLAVAYWPASLSRESRGAIVRWLLSRTDPAMILTGNQVRIRADLSGVAASAPILQFGLEDGGNFPAVADFGQLREGEHTYKAVLPPDCRGGCLVTQLVPYWSPSPGGPQQARYALTLSSIQVRRGGSWHGLLPPYRSASYWAPSSSAVRVARTGSAITFGFSDSSSQLTAPYVDPGPPPTVVPAVVTASSQVGNPGAAGITDFDGSELLAQTRVVVHALPNLGQYGFLIDLAVATESEVSQPQAASDYVWLAAATPPRVLHSLRAQGIRVLGSATPGPRLANYDRSGLALAYRFMLVAAAGAAALALLGLLVALAMAARGRQAELTSLVVAGLGRPTLVRALAWEQLLLVLPALVLGLVAGEVGAVLSLRSLPMYSGGGGAPPLELALPWLPVLLLAGALLGLLL
ncbi:MAG: hypothetical protein ACRENV_03150, partial [Candidatus Dormibacteria bacterium]